jgi:menaquinone-dependent protoporphyrinogen oxidase
MESAQGRIVGANVLVAYATKHGSTAEVAAEVARVIAASGSQVQLLPASDVKDILPFHLIVLGAPLCAGKWHKDAVRLLKRQKTGLAGRRVAIFALGPRSPREEGGWPRCREQLDRALAGQAWLHPVAVELFGGVDPPKKRERRDQRDWAAIRAWAAALVSTGD